MPEPEATTVNVAGKPEVVASSTGGTMITGACVCDGATGATEFNVTLPLCKPGALAVTVTVPGTNVLRSAIFCKPPSKFSSGSPGEWKKAYGTPWITVLCACE